MAKKNIGATLSLKDGGFKAGIKSAVSQLGTFKSNTESATSSLKKMDSQTNTVGQSLGGLVKKIAGAAAAYVGFNQAKDFLTDCVTGVMELERANTRLETLMMNVSGTTKAQVQDLIEYGDALELVTTIEGDAAMAGASQLATFQLSADTIKTLMPAFEDLAVAQYGVNVSQEQMINSGNLIGKVMNGSTGALTKAGVSFTAAQEQILKTGTESEKAAALVEVLGKNFGGLAQQMAQTDEGRIRQLKNAWGSVKDEVGFAVLPAVSSLVQYVAAHIPQIRDTVTNAMQGISSVFGSVWNVAKEIFASIKSAVQENADKFSSLKQPIEGIGTSLSNVFNGNIPLLNLVKDTLIPGIISLLGTAAQAVAFVVKNWDALSPVIYGVVGAIGAYNAITAIKNGLATVAAATTGAEIASFSGLTIAQLASAAATGVLTAAQTALNAVFIASPIGWVVLAIGALIAVGVLLYKNWDTIAKFFSNMWGKIKDGAVACWNGIKTAFSAVGSFISTYVIQPVSSAFSAIGAWLNTHIVQPVKNVFTTIYNIVAPMVTAIVNIYKKIFEIIFTLFKVLAGWLNTHVIQPVIQTFTNIATTIGTFFTNVWTTITGVVTSIFTWFTGICQSAWQSLVNIFTPVAAFFGNIFSSAWNMVVSAFSGVVGFFQNIWNTIKSMFTSIGTAIANGISGAFKSVINSVIRFAGNLINGFINSINWAINVINKIPGVSITKLATVSLPMLAKGGIIQRQGDVIVGERGPEMLSLPQGAKVTPLDKAGTTNHNEFNITIHAENKSVSQILNELIPQLKLALSNM